MQEEKAQQLGTSWGPGGQQEVENSNIFNETQQPCTSIYNQWIYDVIAVSMYNAEEMMNDEAKTIQTELPTWSSLESIASCV